MRWFRKRREASRDRSEPTPQPAFPTENFDLDQSAHVLRVYQIRDRYSQVLKDREKSEFAGCRYRPSSVLPYPKAEIRAALEALLAHARGWAQSRHIPDRLRRPAHADVMARALAHLDDFIDVPAEHVPRTPVENVMFGTVFLESGSLEQALKTTARHSRRAHERGVD